MYIYICNVSVCVCVCVDACVCRGLHDATDAGLQQLSVLTQLQLLSIKGVRALSVTAVTVRPSAGTASYNRIQ